MFKRNRRSPQNDMKIVAKMRSFQLSAPPPAPTSLVSYTSPSLPYPTIPIKAATPPAPANDNPIPVWSLTGDIVTAVCATAALQIGDTPAVAFTFNLPREALARRERFLDRLKRRFDQEVKRRLPGVSLPYWFAIDVTADGRLHIHGAFAADPAWHSAIRDAMKAAWGEWDAPGKHKQLLFKTPCDDGWATYSIRNQRAVAKIIGPRTFTINHPLRRDAEWAYTEIRRIMREDEGTFFCAEM
jgi:hypothetical protein